MGIYTFDQMAVNEMELVKEHIQSVFLDSTFDYATMYSWTCMPAKLLQSCPIFCIPMECSPPGSSVHGILQASVLEWVAMPSSWVYSQSRDLTRTTCVSSISGGFFIRWAGVVDGLGHNLEASSSSELRISSSNTGQPEGVGRCLTFLKHRLSKTEKRTRTV